MDAEVGESVCVCSARAGSLGEPQATHSPCARRRYCLDTSFWSDGAEDASGKRSRRAYLPVSYIRYGFENADNRRPQLLGDGGETVPASAYILLQSGHVNGKKSSAAQPGTVQCSPTWEGA